MKKKPTAIYDYQNEKGEMVYQVLRFSDPKSFSQRRPKDEGWIYSLEGIDRVPYRLPELIVADRRSPVLITEGEKDCDFLRSLGFVATTGPQGQWYDYFGQWLTGRRVTILPDNDRHGELYSIAAAGSCIRHCALSVRILRLTNLGEGEDVYDWIHRQEARTRQRMREALIRSCKMAGEYVMHDPVEGKQEVAA